MSNLIQSNKVIKYKENDFALWINGVEVATDTSGSVPIGLNSMIIFHTESKQSDGSHQQ